MNILQRLSSYINWPRDVHSVSPVVLANAGFQYSGHGDKVTCPVCHIEVEGWQTNSLSDPRTEHVTRSPRCQLALTCSEPQNARPHAPPTDKSISEDDSYSFAAAPDSLQFSNQQAQTSLTASQNNASIFLTSASNNSPAADYKTSSRSPIDRSNPDFDQLRDKGARKSTYYDWPTTSPVTPVDLVENGFFYTGRQDRVQCVFCKGFLHNWVKGDKPASEHKRHFPNCPFVKGKVTDNPVAPVESQRPGHFSDGDRVGANNVVSHHATCGQTLQTGSDGAIIREVFFEEQGASPDEAQSAGIDDDSERLMAEYRQLMEARMCKVCMDKEIDTVFLPCGHLVSCHDCSPKLKHCAICRTYIRGTVKTFFS